MIIGRLIAVGLMTQFDPVFIPYMSGEIILPFNSLNPDLLAPGNRTIHTLVEVFDFIVAVQCLLGKK